jgi:hypothetical protein
MRGCTTVAGPEGSEASLGEDRMRKKVGFGLLGVSLSLLLSGCFMLQSFSILDYTLSPGQSTKARFTLRPSNFDQRVVGISGPQFEFVVIGIGDDSELAVQTAKWGTNGDFGGPLTMPANGTLLAAMDDTCGANGVNFTDITSVVWKLFVTPVEINDRNRYERKAVVEVGIRAKVAATVGNEEEVIGVAGEWSDTNNNNAPDGGDFYLCEGIETGWVHIIAG